MNPGPRRLALPRSPVPPPSHGFPLFATVAPVLGALLLWAMTRSPFALAFAALGPVVALASLADARRQRSRSGRGESARFEAECDALEAAISAAHDDERERIALRLPSAFSLVASESADRWRRELGDGLALRLGTADLPSGLVLTGDAGQADARLDALREEATVLRAAPIAVDARLGIGFVGPAPLAWAAARGILVQLAVALSPAATTIELPDEVTESGWLSMLPHERASGRPGSEIGLQIGFQIAFRSSDGMRAAVAVAERPGQLPREIGVVLDLSRPSAGRIVRHPDSSRIGPVTPELVAREDAVILAARLAALAEAEGVGAPAIPERADFSVPPAAEDPGLPAVIGADERGVVRVDLVRDGPHAIVAGTTGSGKSELLLSWMLSMAASRSPRFVTFLFVDFKGGASFDALRELPHCVGVMTDLDASESLRALKSLSAELRRRERILASHGLRSIDDARGIPPVPRLVVAVDEYAALVDAHTELHAVFLDLAARGRSLGVHLVLCTQRPAGVIRDGILANCGLRLSLRVTNGTDSTAVLGTDAAAALPFRPRGRLLFGIAGEPARLCQVARSTPDDVIAVSRRWRDEARPARPWCPPLPAVIPLGSLATDHGEEGDALPLGLIDLPEQQRQEVLRYDPREHGSLLLVGGPGSGKSTALATIAAAKTLLTVRPVAADAACLWDAIALAERGGAPGSVLLVDDLDAIVAACPEDYVAALLDSLLRLLREAPARGTHAVLAMQRVPGALNGVAALCGSRIVLRMPDRHEYLLAGGEPGGFVTGLPPGAGHWNGDRMQFALAPPAARRDVSPAISLDAIDLDFGTAERFAAISTRPAEFARRLRVAAAGRTVTELGAGEEGAPAGGDTGILVGDPEDWRSRWGALGALRATTSLLFDGCAPAEVRTLTRVRELPPPPGRGQRALWILRPDGELGRARFAGDPAGAAG